VIAIVESMTTSAALGIDKKFVRILGGVSLERQTGRVVG